MTAALTVGASSLSSGGTNIFSDFKPSQSNFGSGVDLFAPGVQIRSASSLDNTSAVVSSGTSASAPYVAGAVALYLEGRTPATGSDCFSLSSPVPDPNAPGSTYAKVSTCPDRVNQYIKSNSNICKWDNSDASCSGDGKVASRDPNSPHTTPDRLLYMGSLPAPTDPIDNHRFYVWQHYGDFLQAEPDEAGLDYWTRQIVDTCSLGVSFNTNNPYCTLPKRVDVSRAFWVAVYPSWFNTSTSALTNFNPAPYSTPNERWLDEVYSVYLRRRPPHNNPYPDWDSGSGLML